MRKGSGALSWQKIIQIWYQNWLEWEVIFIDVSTNFIFYCC